MASLKYYDVATGTWKRVLLPLPDGLADHMASADPHPQYLTPAEGSAAFQPITLAAGVVQSGTTTSCANDTATVVEWNVEHFDYGGFYNPANPTIFTIPEDGLYEMVANVGFAANVTGYREVLIRRNGGSIATVRSLAITGGRATACGVSRIYPCNAGDTLDVTALQTSGGALATVSGYSWTNFTVKKVRA